MGRFREWLIVALDGAEARERALAREVVTFTLAEYRSLWAEVGPWKYAADLGAHPDADLRQIAYLAVWRDLPIVKAYEYVKKLDAVDLFIDAAVEEFERYVAAESRA